MIRSTPIRVASYPQEGEHCTNWVDPFLLIGNEIARSKPLEPPGRPEPLAVRIFMGCRAFERYLDGNNPVLKMIDT
jgi:hypothetical protein